MEQVKKELTLLLLYLNAWEEKIGPYSSLNSWKGYDFDDLNGLTDEEFISGKKRNKSITFTKEGIEEAKRLLEKYVGNA